MGCKANPLISDKMDSWYLLVIGKNSNDMAWFTVSSNHVTVLILKFFEKMKKLEKTLEKPVKFETYGSLPSVFKIEMLNAMNYCFSPSIEYAEKLNCLSEELRID